MQQSGLLGWAGLGWVGVDFWYEVGTKWFKVGTSAKFRTPMHALMHTDIYIYIHHTLHFQPWQYLLSCTDLPPEHFNDEDICPQFTRH